MKLRVLQVLQVLQLLGIVPVTLYALIGMFFGLVALATSFSSGHFWGTLLLGLGMLAPGVMVLCLWVAILYPPDYLLARAQAAAVVFGMFLGCLLAAWLIWSELTAREPELQAIALCGVPLVLAIIHIVAISKASRALEKIPVAEPPSA